MDPKVELRTSLDGVLYILVFAAKLCYGRENECVGENEGVALMRKILEARHLSILEHANVTFYITGVSRNFTHQLVRHRLMSFAQQSLHYSLATDSSIPTKHVANETARLMMNDAASNAFALYKRLLAMDVPKEEARHVLPSGVATKILVTANLRQWMHVVQFRSCRVNCGEIYDVAMLVRAHLVTGLPWLAPYIGPACLVDEACHEGKKSCGKPWGINA